MSKYHSQMIKYDGLVFDSKHEAERWKWLRFMEHSGEIKQLQRQVEFVLQEAFHKNGKRYRKISYFADFVYRDVRTGSIIVEDAKGYKTEVYKIKKKLFEYRYPDLEIREV